jgi:serine-type D-Ala-D-Ala carboxypeptidase (penicillin-binding protein 5/6)
MSILGFACGLLLGGLVAGPALAGPSRPVQTGEPRHWILVDADTGAVLGAGDPHEPVYAASAVKIMTALAALERLPVDAMLTVSASTAGAPPQDLGMSEGESWPVDAAVKGMLLIGANDAAYALAEGAGGSLAGFTEAMTATGDRIGLEDSEFHDPAGLDDTDAFDGGTRMSAYDLAVVARNALAVPELAETLALPEYELTTPAGTELTLTNTLGLLTIYEGATGQKSGFTNQAGSVIVASATRGDRTMIAVGLGVAEPTTWATDTLDEGFASATDASGTGEQLPDVDVASASATARALTGLPRALGRPTLPTGVAGSGSGSAPEETSVADEEPEDSGGLPVAVSFLILALLVAGAAFLVRRIVLAATGTRQRGAGPSAFPEAERRGWLQVVERGDLHEPSSHVRPLRDRRPRSRLPRDRDGG